MKPLEIKNLLPENIREGKKEGKHKKWMRMARGGYEKTAPHIGEDEKNNRRGRTFERKGEGEVWMVNDQEGQIKEQGVRMPLIFAVRNASDKGFSQGSLKP